jgi:hypothetical protein
LLLYGIDEPGRYRRRQSPSDGNFHEETGIMAMPIGDIARRVENGGPVDFTQRPGGGSRDDT